MLSSGEEMEVVSKQSGSYNEARDATASSRAALEVLYRISVVLAANPMRSHLHRLLESCECCRAFPPI